MKKKYGLALGGGAAIGLLHIGVIKAIEEKGIVVKEISGTSMGAIIAAFYAMGKTSDEMAKFAREINFLKMIDFDFHNGLLKGNKISKKLEEMFGNTKIEDLKIKLKIIATNIENGEKKVFKKGKIIDAVRASISLPGVFIPHKIGKGSYIDGGILNNLPVEVLKAKDIIAVSAIKEIDTPIKRKRKLLGLDLSVGFFNMNFQILQRSMILMMECNERISLTTKGKDITFIKCNTGGFDVYSFNKVDELAEIGYSKANNIL